MRRIRKRLPSPALIVAIGALVLAMAGTGVAAGLGILNAKAKDKTVGVGKLTYVTTTANFGSQQTLVTATCPSGLTVIGGGIKVADPATSSFSDSYPTSTGWAGYVAAATTGTATTTAICAKSRQITGAPPAS